MDRHGFNLEERATTSPNKPQHRASNLPDDHFSTNKYTNETSSVNHSQLSTIPETGLTTLRELVIDPQIRAEAQLETGLVARYDQKLRVVRGRIRTPRNSFIPVIKSGLAVSMGIYGRWLGLHLVRRLAQEVRIVVQYKLLFIKRRNEIEGPK